MADWTDENVRIVCELFAEQVEIGNRSSTHLNKAGFTNVIQKFKQRTGILYTRKQFKNKWDKLKVEYGIWKQLVDRQTGIGWDESGKNIDMPEEWWKKMANVSSNKFACLQNEDNLSIMFEDLRNTGDDHWGPSSGVAPSQAIPLDDDDENEGENEDDSDPDEVTPSARPKRGKSQGNAKGKKTKTSGGQWFQEQMGKLVEMNERTTASCESIARGEDKSGSTIQEVMALVKGCSAKPGSNEHFIATVVFTKKAEREMFMTLDTPEERFDWLQKKHEWMTRNDVSNKSETADNDMDDSGSDEDDDDCKIKALRVLQSAQNNIFLYCTSSQQVLFDIPS
ncbi:L10-interacting MYB domain-containing protein-like [Miscanthus floridulus]|uniref:L10-interacting MYB domain-containing protein-like n=1 Tax=Miscanthus floridulus TaxID=154761 RepID=UPI00345AAB6A